jgi:16S rRNA (guanine(966)-N(2))-methyltransferase RsmD
MRIVAGERGGRRISAPRGAVTRPTGDRVREALFSILGDIDGSDVLDAFAGSGALGLEALSRGAERATFWETSNPALRALRANIAALGYGHRATVSRRDAVRGMAADAVAGRRYNLILLDPPYRMLPALQRHLALHIPQLLAPGGLAVVESPGASPAPDLPLPVETTRRYGESRITVFGID